MRSSLLIAFAAMWFSVGAQNFTLEIRPVFSDEKIMLGKNFLFGNGDSLTISTLKFYLGNFEFWKNGQVIFAEKSHRLIDLENENSLLLGFAAPDSSTFQNLTNLDSFQFDLGVDSLTQTSGAMGGDLDPTRGMFWTWQSGYINLKMEGFSSKCPARGGLFEFHLGGYLPPFRTIRRVKIENDGRFVNPFKGCLEFDLAPFFQKIDWQKKSSIMSPGAEAVRGVDVLAKSFSGHEK